MVSTLSAFFTIYMKYDASEYVIPSKRRIGTVAGILISIVAVSVTCEICLIFIQSLPADTREHYSILNQNLTEYANVGFVDLSVLPSAINYVIINTLVLGIPCTAEFLRRKVSSKITPTIDTISESKRAQTLTFLNGLTIQVVLPLLLYVPVFLCQLYTTIAKQEVLFQQYLIFELPVLSTVLDPLISMYFITPYRRTIQKRFKREKQATTDAPIPSVFVAL
ncbi:unnamed protein product [Caenorhabditis nigoni]